VNYVDVAYFRMYLFSCRWSNDRYIGDYLLCYGCSTLSLILLCDVSLLSLNPIVLVKSSAAVFSLR
jgi:hypothetical protein